MIFIATFDDQDTVLRLRFLDDDGRLVTPSMLTEAGFAVGMRVKRKSDNVEGIITTLTPTQVVLDVAGSEKVAQANSFLQGLWKAVKEPKDPVEVTGYPGTEIQKTIFESIIKGRVFLALSQKWDQPNSVKLIAKPKGVVALKSLKAKSLKLPLVTSKVELRSEQREQSLGYICVGTCEQEQHVQTNNIYIHTHMVWFCPC